MVAFDIPGAGVAIVGWISLKMASGWNLFGNKGPATRLLVTNSLIVNLVSFTFSLIGGVICKYSIDSF
jgi:hypothetical protein